MIGGEIVESYFSPSDNTTNAITNILKTANVDIEFATLTFTMNDMRDALFDADANGAYVRGLIENINDTGGDYDALVNGGLDVKDHPASGSIHHKYAIVDATAPNSDPVVITGSHNWSASAENSNDENTLMFHSAVIANIFLQEFEARWAGLVSSVDGVQEIAGFEASIFPNPANDFTTIQLQSENSSTVAMSLWTLDGKLLQSRILKNVSGNESLPMDLSRYPAGEYLVTFQIGQQVTAKKLMIF